MWAGSYKENIIIQVFFILFQSDFKYDLKLKKKVISLPSATLYTYIELSIARKVTKQKYTTIYY